MSTGRIIRRVQAHSQRVNAVYLDDPCTLMFTASYDKSVCIWDLKSNMREPIQVLSDFRDSVTSVTCSDTEIIAGCVDGTLRTYDIRTGTMHTDSFGDPVTWVQLSSDKRSVLCTRLDAPLCLLEIKTGRTLQQYSG